MEFMIYKGLAFWRDEASPPRFPEYFEYCKEEMAKLGLKVLNLIDELCRKYSIPVPDRPDHYDPWESLNDELKEIAEEREARAKLRYGRTKRDQIDKK
jgi:hypothetical protein